MKTAGRMLAIRSPPDPPARVGAVVDVDLQRDQREPVPESRPEGREEEPSETGVSEHGETTAEARSSHGARHPTAPPGPASSSCAGVPDSEGDARKSCAEG